MGTQRDPNQTWRIEKSKPLLCLLLSLQYKTSSLKTFEHNNIANYSCPVAQCEGVWFASSQMLRVSDSSPSPLNPFQMVGEKYFSVILLPPPFLECAPAKLLEKVHGDSLDRRLTDEQGNWNLSLIKPFSLTSLLPMQFTPLWRSSIGREEW